MGDDIIPRSEIEGNPRHLVRARSHRGVPDMTALFIFGLICLAAGARRAGRCRQRGRCRVNMLELTRCPSCLAGVGHCRCSR